METEFVPCLHPLPGVQWAQADSREDSTGISILLFEPGYRLVTANFGGILGAFNMETFKAPHPIDAIFLTGGGFSGLSAGPQLQKFLHARSNVWGCAAYDLFCMREQPQEWPIGLVESAISQKSATPFTAGDSGAGFGTCSGKFFYLSDGAKLGAMKSGLGCSTLKMGKNAFVSAISVVNAVGNIVGENGQTLCGNRSETRGQFTTFHGFSEQTMNVGNTTLSLLLTNLSLPPYDWSRFLRLVSYGQVRSIYPVHTSRDGDVVAFCSNNSVNLQESSLGRSVRMSAEWDGLLVESFAEMCAQVLRRSIYSAVENSRSIPWASALNGVVPSAKDYLS